MHRSLTSLFLIVFIFAANLVTAAAEPVVSMTGKKLRTTQLNDLFEKADNFTTGSPDSLRWIAALIKKEGMRLNDARAIVRGTRYHAQALWRLGNHKEAMQMAILALKDAEKWKLTGEIPDIYAVIGNLHKEKANYSMALASVDKGMSVARKNRDTASVIYMARLEAMFTQGLGSDREDTALIHKSLRMHLEGLKLAESSERFEKQRIGYYNNIAQACVKRGELEQARFYVTKGIDLAKKYNQQLSLTYSYTWLSQVYMGEGDQENCIRYLKEALKITQDLKNPFREMEVNRYLYRALNKMNSYKDALEAYTRYIEIRDSLRVLENVRQIGEMQEQYEAGKKDQQISTLGEINKVKTRETIWALTGLSVFLLLSVFMLFQYRTISRANQELESNNAKINEQAEKLKVLMKELHHRVKNNLQTVSSLLSLQSSRLTDDDARSSMQAGQQRIEAMSLIHKSLYRQDAVNLVDMKEYMGNLIDSVMQSFGVAPADLDLRVEVSVMEIDIDIAMPAGLIVNEWVTNYFKYAYKTTTEPRLSVILESQMESRMEPRIESTGVLFLQIVDNGPGMSLEKWKKPSGSFGMKLVQVLARQLDAKCRVDVSGGTTFIMEIPTPVDAGKQVKAA
ncbi:tetratricopeptide repeat-containing sensor histidine kinase [Dyadobacter crusticola]|uniref:tetratricopeptide repeat-containing sensor histidine kinase n=1 Tax=Dyadobacter crusticola TaxID=292407 RepID=UPI0004E21258|nr:sensor histidine kinase [Dyadobacter crusticola]